MRIITFGNQKGGCGKTTGVQLFANIFSQAPFNVRILVIDLDTQITITETRWADLKASDAVPKYDVLTMSIEDGIEFFKSGLDRMTEGNPVHDFKDRPCFKTQISRTINKPGGVVVEAPDQLLYNYTAGSPIDENYDMILVDMPGTIMVKAMLAPMLAISDGIIIPFKPTEKDMRSTIAFIKVVSALRAVRHKRGLKQVIHAYINEHRNTLKFRNALKLDDIFERQEVHLLDTSLRVRDLYTGINTMMPSLYQRAETDQSDKHINQWSEIRKITREWQAFYAEVSKNPSLMEPSLSV